jgi:hypothetical protein
MKITDPFSISPNPNSLFITPNLKAVLYQARGTINRRQGLVAFFIVNLMPVMML